MKEREGVWVGRMRVCACAQCVQERESERWIQTDGWMQRCTFGEKKIARCKIFAKRSIFYFAFIAQPDFADKIKHLKNPNLVEVFKYF